jgi:ABC-type uncharacterized transport system auxiliary subunit
MIRTLWFLALAAPALLGGCDNRTQEARRWDQISQSQDNGYDTQPWKDAKSPWSSAEHHEGLAW